MSPKSITDPLYGTIAITPTEAAVVSAKTFQRLHNIRQLGLAHLVFPSAGYSRFAHSVGAAHNAARMLHAIEQNSDVTIDAEYRRAYRMAALLHDVGHYPFSHTTEVALSDFYAGSLIQGSLLDEKTEAAESVKHEDLGAIIIDADPEISAILEKSDDIDVKVLKGIFSKTLPHPLFGIISSELDCDRLDYLGRTSRQSGVPFGVVDVEFIISKATLGPDGELAFDRKAAKAIDHLLVGRYYDYMQMVHHKTVEGLEWSLAECIKFALREDPGLLSKQYVRTCVENGNWWQKDDSWFVGLFKKLEERASGSAGLSIVRDHLAAVLYRRPAKRVWKWEAVQERGSREVDLRFRLANEAVTRIAKEMGIDRHRFDIAVRDFKLVKLNSSDFLHEGYDEEKARSVRIRGRDSTSYLVEDESLLIHLLAKMRNFAVSVYYLPIVGEDKAVRDEIRTKLSSALSLPAG
jgi:HD superfamily phosphohydrolase